MGSVSYEFLGQIMKTLLCGVLPVVLVHLYPCLNKALMCGEGFFYICSYLKRNKIVHVSFHEPLPALLSLDKISGKLVSLQSE